VTIIGQRCFERCSSLETVEFESGSLLTRISLQSFLWCSALHSICIPSTVQILEHGCFAGCSLLASVVFESGSHVRTFSTLAFGGCSALPSICIPNSVEGLATASFHKCTSLSSVLFEPISRLQRLSLSAFARCSSLKSLSLPSSLTSFESSQDDNCSLSELTFERPSHVQELCICIPDVFRGDRIEVPESLTARWFSRSSPRRPPILLTFDRDSRLSRWRFNSPKCRPEVRVFFCHFDERTLKLFREVLEVPVWRRALARPTFGL
jgi:hypothetical protein